MKVAKKFAVGFTVSFLISYMLFIFGPAEIFFVNTSEFRFIYKEFAWPLAGIGFAFALMIALLIAFLPEKLYQVVLSALFGAGVAGYVQVMLLNKDLDLLGVTPEGYQPAMGQMIISLVFWCAVIAGVIAFAFWKKELWRKCILGLSGFLICIQFVALVSLWVTAPKAAWEYEMEEGTWHLSGAEQYTVSSKENVIVFLLDYFSNQYKEPLEEAYPGATDFLHDFTYYSNMDCSYMGTFPSIAHLMTGCEVDMSISVGEWFEAIWNSEKASEFYKDLQDNEYKINYYTPPAYSSGRNPELMDGKVSNLTKSVQKLEVDKKLLLETMLKMSGYRLAPDILKPFIYASMGNYEDIVTTKEDTVFYNNYDFYQGLKDQGLTVNDEYNYYILQHLVGTHIYSTDENGNFSENSSLEETAKGCMVIVEDYLNKLKELGVYDNATIIITSDHGAFTDSQVIFWMKKPGESHEKSPVNSAPVSFNEFLPTIADAAGIDSDKYGDTIYDFSEDVPRERTVWVRTQDPAYPPVESYREGAGSEGMQNVYYGYTYTGDIEDLLNQIDVGPSQIVEMTQAYY